MIYDAIIIGAGPAGSSTAILLAKAGWSVALIEKKSFPRRKVCGEYLSATNDDLLKELGVADYVKAHAGPEIKRVGIYAADYQLTSPMPAMHSAWGRALGREELDTALVNQAAKLGVEIWQPWQATAVQQPASQFVCHLKSKDDVAELVSRNIIIAQGSWEKSITNANNFIHKDGDLLAFKAHFHGGKLDPDLMPLLAFPGGYGGLVHTSKNRISLSCCIRRDTLQAVRKNYPNELAGAAVLKHIMATTLGVRNTLGNAELIEDWLAVGPIRPGIRECYAAGIYYVGNIAGEAHPIVAEGISMAMQSSWLLSQVLIQHQSPHEYTRRYRAQFKKRIRAAACFSYLASRPQFIPMLAPIFLSFPKLISYGARLSGKVLPIYK